MMFKDMDPYDGLELNKTGEFFYLLFILLLYYYKEHEHYLFVLLAIVTPIHD